MSYVTGSHSVKVGYQHTLMTQDVDLDDEQPEPDLPVQQRRAESTDGIDFAVAEQVAHGVGRGVRAGTLDTQPPDGSRARCGSTVPRSWFPAQQEGPSRFLPVPIIIPETAGVDSYKDITPRLGVAYDVFGDGRTALKVHLGRYLDGAGTSGIYLNTNPTLRLPQTTSRFGTAGVTRAWSDANGNFVPDCDLLNPGAQDLRASGGDLCGVVSNTKLRAVCADQQLRSGGSQRLGRPAIGLDARRLGAAADSSPGIGHALLQPSLVPWLYRGRQPGAAAVRSDTLQRRGSSRSSPAGRWRLRGVGPVRCRP